MSHAVIKDEPFESWWDPKVFEWYIYWKDLVMFHPDKFPIWWEYGKEKRIDQNMLLTYCSKYFDLWFDEDKFDWTNVSDLILNHHDWFHVWFDVDNYTIKGHMSLLKRHCSDIFFEWVDKQHKENQLQLLQFWGV